MARSRQPQGARTLIFERLAQPLDLSGADTAVARVHDAEGLRNSVREQLTQLLNTRVPFDIDTLEARERTTIDYGLPDLSAFPLGNSEAMSRLARHISRTIAVYEPRLCVRDVILDRPVGLERAVVARVIGDIKVGAVIDPVTFAISVGELLSELNDS
jgi:type VI secretion system lysozyme-like protein